MAFKHGPIYPGIADGLVFAVDPANPKSWAGPSSTTVNNLPTYNNSVSGSISNDTSGSYGQYESFTFDGTDDHISFNTTFSHTNITVNSWVKFNNISGEKVIYDNRDGSTDKVILYKSSPNKFTFQVNGGTCDSDTTALISTWYNYTATYDGSTMRVYINGVEDNTQSYSSTVDITTKNVTIGATSAITVPMNGDIGPVLVYNRTLSASEVLQNYNRVKSRFGL